MVMTVARLPVARLFATVLVAFGLLFLLQFLSQDTGIDNSRLAVVEHRNTKGLDRRISHSNSTWVNKIPIPFGDNGTTKLELSKRAIPDDEWQTIICGGEHVLNIVDTLSHQAAVDYCRRYAPSWASRMASQWENPGHMETTGWVTVNEGSTVRNLHVNRIASALQYYRLSTDPNDWVMRTARHRDPWTDLVGEQHAPTTGFFSYLVNKRTTRSTLIWTAMFSPEYMIAHRHIQTTPPPLRFGSDVYYLQYYRYWAVDREYNGADPQGGSPMPPPKTIIIRVIHEPETVDMFREIKRRQGDTSPRVGAKQWPGDRFTRDNDELFALIMTPIGKGVVWFLTQHKRIFGAKSIGKIRVWSTDNQQDDFNMLFEIVDPPPPDSSGEEAAGPEKPPPERRMVGASDREDGDMPAKTQDLALRDQRTELSLAHNHHRRTNRAYRLPRRHARTGKRGAQVEETKWNGWICLGRAIYELMSAADDATAEQLAEQNPGLVNWRGRTRTQWPDPSGLSKYGWTIFNDLNPNEEEIEVDGAIAGSGLSNDEENWVKLRTTHVARWRDDGQPVSEPDANAHDPTEATYEGVYHKGDLNPTISLSMTFSPWFCIQTKHMNAIEPPLKLMSDLVFLTYYEFWRKLMKKPNVAGTGGSTVPPPRYIFIRDISEDEAVEEIFPEIGRRGNFPSEGDGDDHMFFGNWPGATLTPEGATGDLFYAALATKQGKGIAALMINHKQELGPRRIKSITLWASEEDSGYCARLEMEDSPSQQTNQAGSGFGFSSSPSHERRDSVIFDSTFPDTEKEAKSGTIKGSSSSTVTRPQHATDTEIPSSEVENARNFTRLSRRREGLQHVSAVDRQQWDQYVCTGALMVDLMLAQDVQAMNNIVNARTLVYWQNKLISPWLDLADLATNGWGEITITSGFMTAHTFGSAKPFFEELGIATRRQDWVSCGTRHKGEYEDSTRTKQPAIPAASYDMAMTPDQANPAIVVYNMFSPAGVLKEDNSNREPPALSRFSDVAFLLYSNYWSRHLGTGAPPPCPKVFIIENVVENQAQAVFKEIATRESIDVGQKKGPRFPGVRWTRENEYFKAIMGLPQGRGIALFLFQHKNTFGPQTVKALTYSAGKADSHAYLVFEIGPTEDEDAEGDPD